MTRRIRLMSPLQNGLRKGDPWGSGFFGDPRGARFHCGLDYLVTEGERVGSPCDGVVTRLGRCYGDTPEYELVEIDAGPGLVRLLYVVPEVSPGDSVIIGDTIGYAQNIARRYPPSKLKRSVLLAALQGWGVDSIDDLTPQQLDALRMSNHIHLDVRLTTAVLLGSGRRTSERVFVDPSLLMH